ncbi:hypothetical protein G7074_16185 [Pedobacter sp. HDW13]|uniref:glycosyltransferase family 10 domain-containing protein n=1 Tax=Pedobacter sp. HDW13 TaxID=2714940 RepID=UPI001408B1D3|nr:glycosyltransferase family 10 [Pedobacter sp. HDW13]QIL40667.1 hypothetical protein G7074_16185 [Pedobacter sp. HDW13]
MRKKIHIQFKNGISFEIAQQEIFSELQDEFEFIEENQNPEFILFGPYGNDIPKKGDYVRIGYFCENITPDLSTCEWAFGVPREEEIQDPKYHRIQWHGFDPNLLAKKIDDNEIDKIVSEKKKFCNFIYSNKVPYRESFFRQLSKYKKIDAPSKSMNNMPSIDSQYKGTVWERKRQFLSQYKFTIAFENYAYPGYQTEKLYDAMLVNSLPIYCGDMHIDDVFNTQSFLNCPDYIKLRNNWLIDTLESKGQRNFIDIRPQHFNSLKNRFDRRLKTLGRNLKMKLQFNQLNFTPLIERIIEIDNDIDLYIKYLKEPWLNPEYSLINLQSKQRWTMIFRETKNSV